MAHAHTDARQILDTLEDVDYPAGKDELLAAAERGGASEEVLTALRGIPAEQYANRDEVAHSVRTEPDSDLGHSPGQRDEQARKGGKHGLSQHLRDAEKPPIERELGENRGS